MRTISHENESDDRSPHSKALLWLAVPAVAVTFFVTGHDPGMSLQENFTLTTDELESAAEGGNTLRRAAFAGLAGCGLVLLVLPGGGRLHAAPQRTIPLMLFAAWCAASIVWSDDPAMTVRRLAAMGCLAVAALGFARYFTFRDLVWLVLTVSTLYLFAGVAAELRNGTFRPWSGEFRFAGTLHPNTQGLNLAALSLSALCLARAASRRRLALYLLFGVAMVFLVLTKSRTSLAGVLVALGLIWTVRTPLRAKAAVALAGAWLVAVVALCATLAGLEAHRDIQDLALLGREEEADSLTGRVPLWTELAGWAGRRPLSGYGFDTFWTDERINAISDEMQWGLHEAHSSYLDIVLSVGLIGGGLLLLVLLPTVVRSARLFRATGRPEHAFVFGWLAFALLNGLTESAMTMPLHPTFVAACGLISVLLKPCEVRLGAPEAASLSRAGALQRAPASAALPHSVGSLT
ncbi:MAG TPA: O-antigen ligase family protein [Planctomycetaceae bacterium]|nr:O-antigen ligase family protein [Planctomycetaceae bacterium]